MVRWALLLAACHVVLACDERGLAEPRVERGGTAGARRRAELVVLAVVGERRITAADLARRVASLPEGERGRYREDAGARRELVHRMLDEEILAQEAVRHRVADAPEIADALKQILGAAALERAAASVPPAEELAVAELRAFYDAHLPNYVVRERRRVVAVAFRTNEDAQRARRALDRDTGEARFDALVRASDVDGAGDLGNVGPPDDPSGDFHRVPLPLRRAVFELRDVGEASEPVEHGAQVWLVRYAGRTAAQERSFASEEANLRREVRRRRVEAAQNELVAKERARSGARIDVESLATIVLPDGIDEARYERRYEKRRP